MFGQVITVARHGFGLQKLEKPIVVRNVDRTNNSTRVLPFKTNNECVMTQPKWLSHYLFFFSFSFLLIKKLLDAWDGTTQKRCMGLCK